MIEEGPTSFGAYVPDLPCCVAAGESREEVMEPISETIEFHLEGIKDNGLALPPPHSHGEMVEVHT